DPGIGLPTAESERIFSRFERASNAVARGIEGTGIGLAFVRQVVLAHGGQITAQGREHNGSTFTLTLPLAGEAVEVGGVDLPDNQAQVNPAADPTVPVKEAASSPAS